MVRVFSVTAGRKKLSEVDRHHDPPKRSQNRLDRTAAMHIFEGVLRYFRTGSGDVRPLHGDLAGSFRLRLGDYRVMFELHDDTMRIFGVRHRRESNR
jgi:mRNA-degrading endonuclease RelE of RelBE toxin-antitoxin system